ncbi:hypothetical protein OIU78_015673 [Salix suchowensis]|nr:hypothetical protein OIU78_015673 [Salix suchowensis]
MSGSHVSVGRSKLCQTINPLADKRTRFPVSSRSKRLAFSVFVLCQTVELGNAMMASLPSAVISSLVEVRLVMGFSRFATQTIGGVGIEAYEMAKYQLDFPPGLTKPRLNVLFGLEMVEFPVIRTLVVSNFLPLLLCMGLQGVDGVDVLLVSNLETREAFEASKRRERMKAKKIASDISPIISGNASWL